MTMPTPSDIEPAQQGLPPAVPAPISPRHQLLWFAVGVILVTGLLITLTLSYLRDQAIESGEDLTESFAHVIAEQTARSIQVVDQRLLLAATAIGQLKSSGTLSEASARSLLRDQVKELPFVRALWIMDADGRIIYDSDTGNIGLSLADRAYFQIYRKLPQTGFYVGSPVRSRSTGTWLISATRPLKAPDGSFNGIIAAAIEPPYFDKLWSTVNLGVGGSIALFRRDGTLMMRSPFEDASMGKQFTNGPIFKDLLPANPFGSVQFASAIDGKFRLFAYRSLPEFPDFVAVIGKSLDVILAPWRQLATLVVGIWMIASAVVVTLCLFLDRAWQQRLATDARAHQMAQRLTLATDAAAIGVWDWDMNKADQWFATPTYFTMLGYDPDEGFADRERWVERLHPDDKQAVVQRIQAVLDGHDLPYAYEARLRHADGSYRWVSVEGRVLARDKSGRTSRLMGVRTDITQRKLSEVALSESEERYRQLVDSSPYAVGVHQDGKLVLVNPAAVVLFGAAEAKDLIGRPMRELMHPDERADAVDRLRRMLQGEPGLYPTEDRCLRLDGRVIDVESSATPFTYQGRPAAQLIALDITARKQAEAAVRQTTRQLRTLSRRVLEAQETERRRVAMELHDELGQSLTAIKINLQAKTRFKEQTPDELNAENIRIVEHALQQVRHLALALRPSMLDDLGLVPALRWIAEQTAERGGFTVQVTAPDLQSRLSSDIETACFRVVQEALTNITRHARAQHVKIDVHLGSHALVVNVKDDGCGFDLAAMRERALAGGSIGVLGMQERATLIGGDLAIESTPGQGSTVRMHCPLRRRGERT